MSRLQTIIRNSIEKLHDVGDITEQESDEIFSAAYNLFKYSLNADAYLITALTAWYNEVYNQLKNGKDGNFVSTLPLVPIEPGINDIVGSCLNLLPWHKKVRCAGLPAGILPISRLPWKPKGRLPYLLGVAEGITLYRTNRRINITTLISDRAALFQKVNVKADLNEYVGIDAESSAAKNWWIYYFNEKCGLAGNGVFLPSCHDLWLHAIMKITERFKAKPFFIVTCDNKAKIYIDKESYTKIKPYLSFGVSCYKSKEKTSDNIYDKSIIDTAVNELDSKLKFMLDNKRTRERIELEDGWLKDER
ncbi:MAG: hypothetical protein WBJ85_07070 [Acetomicrobium sp.]|jgi:hypothetical protein